MKLFALRNYHYNYYKYDNDYKYNNNDEIIITEIKNNSQHERVN